jgi:hypothetical protein
MKATVNEILARLGWSKCAKQTRRVTVMQLTRPQPKPNIEQLTNAKALS